MVQTHLPVGRCEGITACSRNGLVGSAAFLAVEHYKETFGRRQREMQLLSFHGQAIAFAVGRVIQPGLAPFGEGFGEDDVCGLVFRQTDIGKEEHIRLVVCHIVVLQQETVGLGNRDGMGQLVLFHDAGIPLQVLVVFWFLQQDETVGVTFQLLYGGMQLGIARLIVFQT